MKTLKKIIAILIIAAALIFVVGTWILHPITLLGLPISIVVIFLFYITVEWLGE